MDSSTNNYAKLEYLGYDRIIINPDKTGMSHADLKAFMDANEPAGFLIEESREPIYKQYAEDYGVSLYVNQDNDRIEKVYN